MKLILSVEPVRFPLTGIGRYTYELALRLQQNPEITDLQFFAGRRVFSSAAYGCRRVGQRLWLETSRTKKLPGG
jgi:hypothetical protein